MSNIEIEKLLQLTPKKAFDCYVHEQYKMCSNNPLILNIDSPLEEELHSQLCYELNNSNGFIYVLENPVNHYYKIGMTRLTPMDRLKSLNSAGVFNHLKLVTYYPVFDVKIEKYIHQQLKLVTPYCFKEFFQTEFFIIDDIIKKEINQFNNFLKTIKLVD